MSTSSVMLRKNESSPRGKKIPRQIVGFSIPPEQAKAVKLEAARRGISLKKLFGEMWSLYQKQTGNGEK